MQKFKAVRNARRAQAILGEISAVKYSNSRIGLAQADYYGRFLYGAHNNATPAGHNRALHAALICCCDGESSPLRKTFEPHRHLFRARQTRLCAGYDGFRLPS